MKIRKYAQFISESSNSLIDKELAHIKKFLWDNGVTNWTEFLDLPPKQRDWVNKIISSSILSKADLDEMRFRLKMDLCDDIDELKEMLQSYQNKEEYERCAIIHHKIKELCEI